MEKVKGTRQSPRACPGGEPAPGFLFLPLARPRGGRGNGCARDVHCPAGWWGGHAGVGFRSCGRRIEEEANIKPMYNNKEKVSEGERPTSCASRVPALATRIFRPRSPARPLPPPAWCERGLVRREAHGAWRGRGANLSARGGGLINLNVTSKRPAGVPGRTPSRVGPLLSAGDGRRTPCGSPRLLQAAPRPCLRPFLPSARQAQRGQHLPWAPPWGGVACPPASMVGLAHACPRYS